MKEFLSSTAMAFSMFSILPAPVVEWKKEHMKYMLCALPLVGMVMGAALYVWLWLCQRLNMGTALSAAGMTLIPLFLSGGIHMDGFCDTTDALASHTPAERKREILKDSHTGAFAVIFTAAYLLLYISLCMELTPSLQTALVLGLHQIFSRSMGHWRRSSFPLLLRWVFCPHFGRRHPKKQFLSCFSGICFAP